jgi:hypothetical protein
MLLIKPPISLSIWVQFLDHDLPVVNIVTIIVHINIKAFGGIMAFIYAPTLNSH